MTLRDELDNMVMALNAYGLDVNSNSWDCDTPEQQILLGRAKSVALRVLDACGPVTMHETARRLVVS